MGNITRTQFGCTKTIVLTAAELIQASTAPLNIIAGVVGKILIPVFGLFRLNWVADFTNVQAAGFLSVGTSQGITDGAYFLTTDANAFDNLLAGGADMFQDLGSGNGNGWIDPEAVTANYITSPLQFVIDNAGGGAIAGGLGSTGILEVHYLVI